ncbi:hypothetical protein J6590_048540 [Homalodisca vitripennis]|nr:hypothetical protein J6590_048540 [Homalodisca vitripennis]
MLLQQHQLRQPLSLNVVAGAGSTPSITARRPTAASAAPPADAAPTIHNAAGVPRNCAVRLTQRSTHVVFPCGHLCMCTECSDTLPGYQVNLQCPRYVSKSARQ